MVWNIFLKGENDKIIKLLKAFAWNRYTLTRSIVRFRVLTRLTLFLVYLKEMHLLREKEKKKRSIVYFKISVFHVSLVIYSPRRKI